MTTQPRMRWWSSIQWRLILFGLVISIIPMRLTNNFLFNGASNALLEQSGDDVRAVASTVGSALERYLFERRGDVQLLAGNETLVVGDAEHTRDEQTELLRRVVETYNAYEAIYLLDTEGRLLLTTQPTRSNFADQAWFQAVMADGELFVSDPYYLSAAQRIVMTVATPVYNRDGAQRGVLAAHLDINRLGGILEEAQVGEDGEVFIVNREGVIVLDNNINDIFNNVSELPGMADVLSGESGTTQSLDDDSAEPVLLSFAPLAVLGKPWVVVAALPLAELNAPVEALQATTLTIGVLVAALVVGIVVFISNRLISPIRSLTTSAQRLREGDFRTPIPVQTGDEIGQLAQTFRGMAGELQELIDSLESRVQTRTNELVTTVEVGRLANTVTGQGDLLPKLVEFIRSKFNLYYTQIYLLDDAARYAVLRAGTGEAGQALLARGHRLDMAETSLVSSAVQTGQPVVVSDTAQNRAHKANPLLPDTRSEVAIPLKVGDVVLGVLDMQNHVPNTFTPDNAPVFEAMAGQIAAVLRSAQAFDDAQAAAQRAEALNRRLTEQEWQTYQGTRSGKTAYRYDLEKPERLEDTSELDDTGPFFLKRVVEPIVIRGATVGKIVIKENDGRREISDEDRALINDTARAVGQALEQYRSNDAVRLARARAEKLASINAALSQANDETAILAAVSRLGEGYNVGISSLTYLHYDALGALSAVETMALRSGDGTPIPVDVLPSRIVTPQEVPMVLVALENPNSVFAVGDLETDPRSSQTLLEYTRLLGIRGLLTVPLFNGEQRLALVTFTWGQSVTFSRDLLDMAADIMPNATSVVASRRAYLATREARSRAELLASVSSWLSQATDEDEILEAVANLVEPHQFGLGVLSYTRLDESGHVNKIDMAAMRAGDGSKMPLDIMPPAPEKPEDHPMYPILQVIDANPDELLVIEDMATDPRIDRSVGQTALEIGSAATIVLPLRSANRWIGLMTFAWPTPRNFSSTLVGLLADLLPTLASVVATRAAYLESVSAQLESETLYQVSTTVNEAADERSMISAIVRHLLPEPATQVTLGHYLRDANGQPSEYLVVVDWQRGGNDFSGMRVPLESVHLPANFDQSSGTMTVIRDVETDPTMDAEQRAFTLNLGVRSVITYNIMITGQVYGTLSINAPTPYAWSDREIRTFRAAATQIEAALERLHLARQTERSANEMATIAQLGATVTTTLDLDELLQSVVELTKLRFNLYHAHIYLLDEETELLRLAAGAGDPGRIMRENRHVIPLNRPTSLVARTARERRGIVANDITLASDHLPNPLLPDTRAELSLPLIVGERLLGVLDMQSTEVNRFTQQDVLLKTALADQVAVAIQNALAYQEQQTIAERLREVDRLKSQFLANMSHELRTPLNSIIGYAEVLLDGIDGDLTSEAAEDVQVIHGSGRHLLAIINDILDLAKIEAGQMNMDRRQLDLPRLLEDTRDTLEILARNKGLALHTSIPADLPPVLADGIRIKQVIINLINNAIKFTDQGSVNIELSVTPLNTVLVRVHDTGIGMTEDDMKGLFQQFHQVDGSPTRRAGGTGLGLVISRHLVQMHGSDIRVTSEKGIGSVFEFELPIFQEAAQPV